MTSPSPNHLKYTASHEWANEESADIVTIGITEHAQSLLGDVVFVELPEVGKNVAAGEGVAVIESVKAAADVYAPVSGEVVEVNDALTSTPELVNSSPYENGWLCKLKMENKEELDKLMLAEAYDAGL
ncbi:MAG: glycine cleavage system protein [Gammaproteobacteria bacterium]|jgi:glycine cleavage system H protein|nr:glycine cleavage system protein [Gammaproteobacteria bacterium]